MRAPDAFGAYGKMPALGDFFRIGVAQGFVRPWDQWLQGGLSALKQMLGERWQSCYMTAPIWRFTLSPGLAGPEAALGVLMASVDRVGREFPLTLVAALPGRPAVLQTHFAADPVFEALELLALDALDDAMTTAALGDRLRAIGPIPPVAAGRLERAPGVLILRAPEGQEPAAIMAAQLAGQGFRTPSVWSAGPGGGGRLMITEGLPDPRRLQALFDLEAGLWGATGSAEARP
jgi:type VI secretion system protein ImpM